MNMGKRSITGRTFLSLAILLTLGVTLAIDWNVSHMVDPKWPPHARYHLLVYQGTMLFFTIAALWCIWGYPRNHQRLTFAFWVSLGFLLPFFPAALFPTVSVYATKEMAEHKVPINLIACAVLLVLSVLGYLLSRNTQAHNGEP